MCLGVPGKILSIEENDVGMAMGRVSFSGIVKDVCLAYVPEAKIDDYVIVHVGFAISRVDPAEAQRTLALFAEVNEVMDVCR